MSEWATWPSSWATTDRSSGSVVAVDQRVVEHDPLRRPDPGDVGVQRRAAAARVDAVDVPDLHPRPLAELDDVGAQLARLRKLVEVVEPWRDQDRSQKAHRGAVADDHDRARYPPPTRRAANQRGERGGAGPGDDAHRSRGPSPGRQATARATGSKGPTSTDRSCAASVIGNAAASATTTTRTPAAAVPRTLRDDSRARRSRAPRGRPTASAPTTSDLRGEPAHQEESLAVAKVGGAAPARPDRSSRWPRPLRAGCPPRTARAAGPRPRRRR